MRDLSIFLSHPIQHYVPWFQALNDRLDDRFKVYYASHHGVKTAHDPEFGEKFAWDMDLLSGYSHEFLPAPKREGGPNHGFWGVRCPHVREVLAKDNPKVVMIFGWLFSGYWEVARAAAKLGIPYILRGESNLLNRGHSLKWWVKNQTVGRLCRGAATCLAIGQRNQELFRAYGVPEKRIQVAPYFVDNDLFASESARLRPERVALRARYGLPQDAVIFLFMGKLIQKKHPDHLLQAWQGLPGSLRERSALLFGGSGAMMEELKEQAQGDPRVAFAGFLNRKQLPEAYAVSDVLILPSDEGETWGLVVNEAMVSGLPAVVSDRVGCAPDLVLDGRTGYSYPFGAVPALKNVMARLIENSEDISSMGIRATRHVEIATAEIAADAVIDVLNSVNVKNKWVV